MMYFFFMVMRKGIYETFMIIKPPNRKQRGLCARTLKRFRDLENDLFLILIQLYVHNDND